MMLNFFGMKLIDITTGKVARHSDYKDRYANLNYNSHNHHRISNAFFFLLFVSSPHALTSYYVGRILTSLGELGFVRYKKPLVEHLTEEIEKTGELQLCKKALQRFVFSLCSFF